MSTKAPDFCSKCGGVVDEHGYATVEDTDDEVTAPGAKEEAPTEEAKKALFLKTATHPKESDT